MRCEWSEAVRVCSSKVHVVTLSNLGLCNIEVVPILNCAVEGANPMLCRGLM